jgi:Fe-S cluster assembly protein SufD
VTTITPQAVGAFEGPDWLRASRSAAAERAAARTMPSAEEEIWRYSRIAELDLDRFVASAPVAATVERGPAELLSQAAEESAPAGTDDLFTDLNAALAARQVVRVPAGRAVAEPLVLVHTSAGASSISASHLVIEAGADAEITVVERFVGGGGGLLLPAVRLVAHPSARIRYMAVNELDRDTWFIAHQVAEAERDATVSLATVAFGGDYARVRTEVRLVGQGAHADQIGLSFGEGNQMHDLRVLQEHVAPRTTSNLLFKGAVQDSSRSVYTGLIRIGKLARGANAFQTNRNLKLSDDAWADSVPNLDIENNDVRCSHASTVGPIDDEQRFYLESRGVPPVLAERLIVLGFFDEVLAKLADQSLVAALHDEVGAKLDRRRA